MPNSVTLVDASGVPVGVSGNALVTSGGGGGGGDATAANQTLQIAQETAINTALGTVTANPTANTVLDRLKALLTGTILAAGTAIIGKVGIDQTTPGTTNLVQVSSIGGAIVPGTAATNLGKAEDAVHTTGDTGVFALGVANEAQSALAADGDYIAQATDTKGNRLAVGNLAHDAADAGFPLKIGGQARTTNPAAVADADRVNATYDKVGRALVQSNIRTLKGSQRTVITSSTAETTIATAVASTFLDLYGLILQNSSASATTVDIRDDTAGTVIASIVVPAGDTRGFMLPADAGFAQTAVNKNWTAQCGTSVASLTVTALFVKNI